MHHTVSPDHLSLALSLAAGCLALAAGAAIARLHALPTRLDPIRDAVSAYGAGRFRIWYQAGAACLGLSALLLAWALGRDVRPVPVAVVWLLVAFGASRLAITQFPTDLPGEPHSGRGAVHLLLAATAFATIAVAASDLAPAIRADPAWSADHRLVAVLGWVVVIAAIFTGLGFHGRLRGRFGLLERLLYVAMIVWLAAAAGCLAYAVA